MKKILCLLGLSYMLFAVKTSAQIVTDTIGEYNPSIGTSLAPIYIYYPGPTGGTRVVYNMLKYNVNELTAHNILPGDTIYGVSFYKMYPTTLPANFSADFQIGFRSGSDSIGYDPFAYPGYSPAVYWPIMQFATFGSITQYDIPNDISIATLEDTGWINFMLDAPFIYNGGSLELWSSFYYAYPTGFPNNNNWVYAAQITPQHYARHRVQNTPNDFLTPGYGSAGNTRPITIFYNTESASNCTGTPSGGTAVTYTYTCSGADFTIYLHGASAGPGITYQWESSPLTPVSWSPIPGATNSIYQGSANSPTQYRVQVTCSHSGLSSASLPATILADTYRIDSLAVAISGNTATITIHESNDYNQYTFYFYDFGDGTIDTLGGEQEIHQYLQDGTYTVMVIATSNGQCGIDTGYVTFQIGCSPLNNPHVIIADDHHICPGDSAVLSVQNPLPTGYTYQWERLGATGIFYPIVGATQASYKVSPPGLTIYRNTAICSISTNEKISNLDTIFVSPAPFVAAIQALPLSTNTWQFAGINVQNTHSYEWDFGDGDTSHAPTPTHHYPFAGNYTVTLIVTNHDNDCKHTVSKEISVLTHINETNQSNTFFLFPNPAVSTLNIHYTAHGTLIFKNITGKTVAQIALPENQNQWKMDISEWNKGIYLYTFIAENNTVYNGKLVIVR